MKAILTVLIFGFLDFSITALLFSALAFCYEFPIGFSYLTLTNDKEVIVALEGDKNYHAYILSKSQDYPKFQDNDLLLDIQLITTKIKKEIHYKVKKQNFRTKIEGTNYSGVRICEFNLNEPAKVKNENNIKDLGNYYFFLQEDQSFNAIASLLILFVSGFIIALFFTVIIYKKWISIESDNKKT
jgi:hypothetical protein